jgi:hypothetical protein
MAPIASTAAAAMHGKAGGKSHNDDDTQFQPADTTSAAAALPAALFLFHVFILDVSPP